MGRDCKFRGRDFAVLNERDDNTTECGLRSADCGVEKIIGSVTKTINLADHAFFIELNYELVEFVLTAEF